MTEKLKVLDLFSGAGMFSYGLERTQGFETVAFCEILPYAQKILATHWPEIPIYVDVTSLTKASLSSIGIAPDVITGGFPCQDLSVAGKQAGIGDGTRSGLWSECLRLVSEIRPKYAIFENVTNLLSGPSERRGGWFSRILRDLASVGYDVVWHDILASDVGLPHARARVWIIAYPSAQRPIPCLQGVAAARAAREPRRDIGRAWLLGRDQSGIVGDYDGDANWLDRHCAIGNSLANKIPELIGYAILDVEAQMRSDA